MHARCSRTVAMVGGFCLMAAATLARSNDADTQLQAIYKAEWQWRERELPDTEDSQKPILDHLAKVDPAAQSKRLQYWQEVLHKLDEIHRADLTPDEQVNYDVYHPQIEALISSQKFREFEMPAKERELACKLREKIVLLEIRRPHIETAMTIEEKSGIGRLRDRLP